MVDALFGEPRLAALYDAFDGDRDDLDLYVDIVAELAALTVLDVGCGTGSLAIRLAERGVAVTGVDPAKASLDVAAGKDTAGRVAWIHGDATTLPPLQVDVATMTGNVAQVFLNDDDWLATLAGVRAALSVGGHLVCETRRPERRAWEEWAADTEPLLLDVPGCGLVERRMEFVEAALPLVSFGYSYRFHADGAVLTSRSTLRFRSRGEVERSLSEAGFNVIDVRDAPDRPGREYVFIAQRRN